MEHAMKRQLAAVVPQVLVKGLAFEVLKLEEHNSVIENTKSFEIDNIVMLEPCRCLGLRREALDQLLVARDRLQHELDHAALVRGPYVLGEIDPAHPPLG